MSAFDYETATLFQFQAPEVARLYRDLSIERGHGLQGVLRLPDRLSGNHRQLRHAADVLQRAERHVPQVRERRLRGQSREMLGRLSPGAGHAPPPRRPDQRAPRTSTAPFPR